MIATGNAAPALHWKSLDLASPGRTLIEASAGTGKTWTIAVLYLRLLLERGLSPRQVVVTTFTDAAAQELRERLRSKLVWAELAAQAWAAEGETADASPDLVWLQSRWLKSSDQAERDRIVLALARAELDMAPVGTLHSLCRRVLGDYPFESGSSFGLGELVPGDALLDEWSADLWRSLQQGEVRSPATPESLSKLRGLLKAYLQPGVSLWSPDDEALDALLPVEQADALDAFAADKAHFLPRKSALKNALTDLAQWLRDRSHSLKNPTLGHLLAAPVNAGEQLQPAAIESAAGQAVLAMAVRAGLVLGYATQGEHVRAWQSWLDQVNSWREQRLAARGQLSFDELIVRVRTALHRPDGALAERLHEAWPVALVDEFQDTDGQQYDILQAIYSDADGNARGRLVMIGDPKQAIYRFRGGDIHTYLRAAEVADQRLRLDTNYRSSRTLIAAVNQFYDAVGPVLSVRDDAPIRYEPVHASPRRDSEPYTIDGAALARPLQLHLKTECPGAVPVRSRMALQACARQIAALLQSGTHCFGETPVQPGDLAVLLPNNQDINDLRAMLQALGVPCVGAGRRSVFELPAARELQIVLYAIAHAGDEGGVRAALATRLYGMSFSALKALREQPEAWLEYEQQFSGWRTRWQREGVLAVVGALIERAAPMLLATDDGERTLTDLRHLGELLQAQSEKLHGPEQLLAWMTRQREGESTAGEAADEQQLRIESDARRVRLMTLHASKGLEFPIVFLPLMWDHTRSAMDTIPVLDEPLAGRRVIGFGAAAKARYDEDGQDERFRVLYVALTRAIHACHVYVLPPGRPADARIKKDGEPVAPLSDPARSPLDASIERLQARQDAGFDLAVNVPQLGWQPDEWPWRASRMDIDVQTSESRTVLPLPSMHPDQRVYSFSTLTRSAHAGALEDAAASDESPAADTGVDALDMMLPDVEPAAPHPELQALASIRGADIGNALHAMFENRVIGQPMTRQLGLIERSLRDFGVPLDEDQRPALIRRLARRVQANLDAPLLPGLRLGDLAPEHQLAEMEFHYVLDDASMTQLRDACARYGEPDLVPATTLEHLRGRMTGKIDLIIEHEGRYLVLDYKSNWLGEHLDGYMPRALGTAMDAHQYRFQALLYTVAVDRMLRQRVSDYRREQHLGGALYVFIRAVGLAPEAGIWRHRFDDALIAAVEEALAGTEAGENA